MHPTTFTLWFAWLVAAVLGGCAGVGAGCGAGVCAATAAVSIVAAIMVPAPDNILFIMTSTVATAKAAAMIGPEPVSNDRQTARRLLQRLQVFDEIVHLRI